jgi:glycosyltransferase involved in cell wall biosynthesis
LDKGLEFHWQVVGPGDASPIIQTAKQLGVSRMVEFVGAQDNPYPYINACDIYVQPSRYEGHSVTVREAQLLYKPVVITNYNTAANQVQSGVDGIICALDNEAIANAICELAGNKDLYQSIVDYLHCHDYGNEDEVNKIYQLLCR